MKLGVPNQSAQGEPRVAIVPEVVRRLDKSGVQVVVETGAGERSHHPDSEYEEAGATIGDPWGAEGVAVVSAPSGEQIGRLSRDPVPIGFLAALTDAETTRALAQQGVPAFAMEAIPGTSRAQSLG